MNYKIDAIDILLDEECILQRYYPLIPFKKTLITNLHKNNYFSKEDCVNLLDEILLKMGLPSLEMVNLFKSFLVMYDIKSQKLKEIDKLCNNEEEKNSFRELYLLPGVKYTRAKLYNKAGYKYLRNIASDSPEQIINRTTETIKQEGLNLKAPLLKEVKTHIAVAKTYTYFQL